MAKANWVKTTPNAGNGSMVVEVSPLTQNTGRNARTTTLTWKAANVTDVVRTVSQAGKPNNVDIDDSATSKKEGQIVTIKGVSNSAKLTFSLNTLPSIDDGTHLNLTLPATYIANSMTISNGANITGDPGATQEYEFSISITVPKNEGTAPKTRQLIVTNELDQTDTCTITLAAGDPYITISDAVIELKWDASDKAFVSVDSNTSWEII